MFNHRHVAASSQHGGGWANRPHTVWTIGSRLCCRHNTSCRGYDARPNAYRSSLPWRRKQILHFENKGTMGSNRKNKTKRIQLKKMNVLTVLWVPSREWRTSGWRQWTPSESKDNSDTCSVTHTRHTLSRSNAHVAASTLSSHRRGRAAATWLILKAPNMPSPQTSGWCTSTLVEILSVK